MNTQTIGQKPADTVAEASPSYAGGRQVRMTAQEAMDRGLGLGSGSRIDPAEAISRCGGITKRLGFAFSSDDFLAMRRQDKEFEDRLD